MFPALILCALLSPALAGDPPPAAPAPPGGPALPDAAALAKPPPEPLQPGGPLASLAPLAAGKARLVIFRGSSFRGAVVRTRIKIGDNTVGWISNASIEVVDVEPGDLDLKFDNPLNFGHTGFPITVAVGETHYLEMKPTIYHLGVIGAVDFAEMAKENQVCERDWCVSDVNEHDARSRMEGLSLENP